MKIKYFNIIALFTVFSVGALLLWVYTAIPTDMYMRIRGYDNIGKMAIVNPGHAICDALLSECGVCVGKELNGYCYVKR